MFTFLCYFGPAAVTWLLAAKLSHRQSKSWMEIAIQLLVYACLDMATTLLLLYPYGKVEFVTLPNGLYHLHYGGLAFCVALAAGVLWGLILAMAHTRLHLGIHAEKIHKEEEDHEEQNEQNKQNEA